MEKGTGAKLSVKIFWLWLTLAAVVTISCGLAYLLVQQDIRQSANYPQSQIAEDAVSATVGPAISNGANTANAASPVNVSASLAPFLTTFDANGNVIRSNAVLGGSIPVPPHGVFGYAVAHGEDRFTWQPESGVRIAAVLVYHPGNAATGAAGGFFALSGRSLRDVEILEGKLTYDAFFVWIFALIVTFFFSIILAKVYDDGKATVASAVSSQATPSPLDTTP